jgi:cytochrome c biogenesis protein
MVLASVKLTLFLFSAIAVGAVMGSIIPQNLSLAIYHEMYGERLASLIKNLGLNNIFHSWWFLGLLLLLSINLLSCSLDRIPKTWRFIAQPMLPLTERRWSSLSIHRSYSCRRSPEEVLGAMCRDLSGRGWRVKTVGDGEILHLMAQRGRLGRMGYIVTHCGVMVILLGALLGFLFGFEGSVRLQEGQGTSEVMVEDSGERVPLGFSVECEDFSILTYPDGSPRQYRSVLVFNSGPHNSKRAVLMVNRPVEFGGYVFYQHSYGISVKVELEAKGPKAHPRRMLVDLGETVALDEEGGLWIRPIRYTEDINGRGPAILMAFFPGHGHPLGGWLLKDQGTLNFHGWSLKLLGIEKTTWTGIYVKRDPGVIPVFVGSCLIIIGCIIAFLVPHQRIWARLRVDPHGGTEALLAGSSSKYRKTTEGIIERVWERASKRSSGSDKGVRFP